MLQTLLSLVSTTHGLTGCEVVTRHCVVQLVGCGADLSHHLRSDFVDVLRLQISTQCSREKK